MDNTCGLNFWKKKLTLLSSEAQNQNEATFKCDKVQSLENAQALDHLVTSTLFALNGNSLTPKLSSFRFSNKENNANPTMP
jgi:hypothetical protein